jgi:hypothetical protein
VPTPPARMTAFIVWMVCSVVFLRFEEQGPGSQLPASV